MDIEPYSLELISPEEHPGRGQLVKNWNKKILDKTSIELQKPKENKKKIV